MNRATQDPGGGGVRRAGPGARRSPARAAGTMLAAIDRDRYDVIPVGILPDGRWVLTADEPERLAIAGGQMPSVESVAGPEPGRCRGPPRPSRSAVSRSRDVTAERRSHRHRARRDPPRAQRGGRGAADPARPVRRGRHHPGPAGAGRHPLRRGGRPGQRGQHGQGVHEADLRGARGLPVGPFVVVRDRDWQPAGGGGGRRRQRPRRKPVLDAIAELGWPVFVKPARGGSSIGTSKAADLAGLHEAIETARRYDPKVLVEKAIDGREIECARA